MCLTSAGKTPTNFFAQLKRLKLLGTKVKLKILKPQNTSQKFCESAVNKKNPIQVYLKLRCQLHQICTYTQLYTFTAIIMQYVVPENIHTPTPPLMEGTFALEPPPCWNFHSRKCLSYLPTPCNFHDSSILIGYPLKRIFLSKILFHYTIMQL